MTHLTKRKRNSDFNDEQRDSKRSRLNANDIFTITTSSNRIIYSEMECIDDYNSMDFASQMDSSQLLNNSIPELLENIKISKMTNNEIEITNPISSKHEGLWVDKYSPKKFRDLLSNEKTNREVLKWIKQWDDVVFKKASLKKGNDTRPEKKIILLSGQPGIGKTTLAHVLANHCGYNPMEINASDDRTASKFKPKIESAIQMKSVFGNCKPNFIIIDEIDGISSSEGASVSKVLIDLALNTKKPLRRPIICICNDPYAPALRSLRKHVMLFKLDKPKTSILSCRLVEICKNEGIKSDAHTLSTLCTLSNNDIRSCLNSLQFIKRRTNSVNIDILKSSIVGHKDITKSVFNVWDEVFCPQYKKQAYQARICNSFGVSTSNKKANNLSSNYLYNLIISNGNIDKIIEGCHEHYPLMKYLDTNMIKTTSICDYISWASDISTKLSQYSPFGVMKITQVIPQETQPKLHFPLKQYQTIQDITQYKNILQSFYLSMNPLIYNYYSQSDLPSSFFSYFMKIITSNIRIANNKLLSSDEKNEQKRIVEIMNDYGISYIQEMEIDTITNIRSLTYKMDPPVDKLSSFNMNEEIKLNNNQKHSIAMELEKHKFKSDYRKRKFEERAKLIEEKKKQVKELQSKAEQRNTEISNSKLENKIQSNESVSDFFGRDITNSETYKQKSPKYSKYTQHKVFFKYQEGFTNAVRRTVKVKDFL